MFGVLLPAFMLTSKKKKTQKGRGQKIHLRAIKNYVLKGNFVVMCHLYILINNVHVTEMDE